MECGSYARASCGMVQILSYSGNSTDRPHASTVGIRAWFKSWVFQVTYGPSPCLDRGSFSVVGPMAGSGTLVAVKARMFKINRDTGLRTHYRGGVICLYDTQLLGPACTHPSPVAALALRPSGACQTYQSPPQPPGPRRGGRLSALSAQPLSTGGCRHVC